MDEEGWLPSEGLWNTSDTPAKKKGGGVPGADQSATTGTRHVPATRNQTCPGTIQLPDIFCFCFVPTLF